MPPHDKDEPRRGITAPVPVTPTERELGRIADALESVAIDLRRIVTGDSVIRHRESKPL